jgi:SAM-dependent methyltransferase
MQAADGFSFDELFDVDEYLYFMESTLASEDTPKQCDFIESVLRLKEDGVAKDAKVLDLGCGHGRHALELASRGYKVLGLDLVEGFLRVAADDAKKRGLELTLAQGDARTFVTEPTFDGIVCLFDAFGYFGDEDDQQVLLNVYQSLVPGGRFLLDLRPREIVGRMAPMTVLDKGADMMIDRHHFDMETGRLVDRRTYVRNGRTREVTFSVRLYTYTEIRMLLRAVGFEIGGLYGDYDLAASAPSLASRRMLVLARKPA